MSMLKRKREKAKMSQWDLARKLGVHAQFVSNWERNVCSVPLKHLDKVSVYLDIPKKKLLQMRVDRYQEKLRAKINA